MGDRLTRPAKVTRNWSVPVTQTIGIMPEEDEEGDLTVNILLIRKARAYKTDNFSFYKRFCTL